MIADTHLAGSVIIMELMIFPNIYLWDIPLEMM